MHDVEVDVVGLEPAEAGFAGFDDMVAGRPAVVRAVAHREGLLGRDQGAVALALERPGEELLGHPLGAAHLRYQNPARLPGRTSMRRRAPSASVLPHALKNSLPPPRKACGAEAGRQGLEAGAAERAIFHAAGCTRNRSGALAARGEELRPACHYEMRAGIPKPRSRRQSGARPRPLLRSRSCFQRPRGQQRQSRPPIFFYMPSISGWPCPDECLVIEDSVAGVTARKAAGDGGRRLPGPRRPAPCGRRGLSRS